MGTRRKSRELVLQMLFQADMGRQNADDVRRTFWGERSSVDAEIRGFAEDLFRVATDRTPEIDGLIGNIMRAAVAELLGFPTTPRAVIINEALEIARKFSNPESVQFINGVLDSVGRDLEKARA
ncbi:MAG: transcription antitermination factor NusB [Acidobacteriales bacterium 13_1_40CM_3_55_5]|nr:MAG: transcription antitermination factor NusB [Acidobacteriales bacterium 13_1_40CM_3_55_5]